MKNWSVINAVLLLASAVAGPFVHGGMALPEDPPGVKELLILALAPAVGVLFVGALAYVLTGGERIKPSIRRFLLNPRNPMQMIYMGGLTFLASGLGCAVAVAFGYPVPGWELFIVLGFGCAIGSYLDGLLFAGRRTDGE